MYCDCDRALELISLGLDGALDEAARRELDEHLAGCPACRSLAGELEELHSAIPELEEEVPEGFHQAVMDRVRGEKTLPFPVERKRGRQWRRWVSMAAVFAVLLVGAGTLARYMKTDLTAAPGLAMAEPSGDAEPKADSTEGYRAGDTGPEPAPKGKLGAAPRQAVVPEVTTAQDIAPFSVQGVGESQEDSTLSAPTEEERLVLTERCGAWLQANGPEGASDSAQIAVAAVTFEDLERVICPEGGAAPDLDDWRVTVLDSAGGNAAVLLCDRGTLEVLGYLPIE